MRWTEQELRDKTWVFTEEKVVLYQDPWVLVVGKNVGDEPILIHLCSESDVNVELTVHFQCTNCCGDTAPDKFKRLFNLLKT